MPFAVRPEREGPTVLECPYEIRVGGVSLTICHKDVKILAKIDLARIDLARIDRESGVRARPD
jgi:hypothetical protein